MKTLLVAALGTMLVAAGMSHAGQPIPRGANRIDVTVRPIPLNPEAPGERQLGLLTYMGGLELVSKDLDFGGISGLAVAADQSHLLAITDAGRWVCATIESGKGGTLRAVKDVWMMPFKSMPGFDTEEKKDFDAEALAITPRRRDAYVSFEGKHRVWRYGIDDHTDLCSATSSAPRAVSTPTALIDLPNNGGIESLAVMPDGRLIMMGEDRLRETRAQPGWIGTMTADGAHQFKAFAYDAAQPFSPTDVTANDDGIFVLHRHFSLLSGVSGMLSWSALPEDGKDIHAQRVASFRPPVSVDNFEGISAVAGESGSTVIYIVSDDNFSPLQRTLLLKFSLSSEALQSLTKP